MSNAQQKCLILLHELDKNLSDNLASLGAKFGKSQSAMSRLFRGSNNVSLKDFVAIADYAGFEVSLVAKKNNDV